MSELSDFDDGGSIDWNEAIAISDAAETARLERTERQSPSTCANNNIISPTDEEVLFLYDVVDTTQYELVNKDGQDMEDLGMKKTLFDQFRKRRGFLSVTDLTAPSGWCEVQYAYSLLGRRDLKPEKRPEKIITAAGNEIKVNKKLAVAHEKMLEKGRQVHAVLEREVHPEQLLIRTETKADRWGLRLLNQIVSLVTLRDAGKAREIPVFGFFGDVFVLGVMDEIEKRPLSGIEDAKDSKAEHCSSNKITDFFKAKLPTVRRPTHGYYLVDSKTRRMPTLPKREYTVASRYQLMLYRYLYNKHANDSFDWTRLWAHVGLSPEDALSASFLRQTESICIGSNLEDLLHLTTIGELAEHLRNLHLEVGQLQEQLELVYRRRGSSDSRPRRSRRNLAKNRSSAKVAKNDIDDFAQPRTGLSSSTDRNGTAEAPIDIGVKGRSESRPAVDDSDMFVHGSNPELISAERGWSVNGTQTTTPQSPSNTPQMHASGKEAPPMDIWDMANKAEIVRGQEEGSVIGTEKFLYKEEDMMEYVNNTVAFWTGREARGVSLEETSKCRSCEFQDGCEWLAVKAEEHAVRARKRRLAKEAKT